MLDDIQTAPSPADRATALSQFTLEFGEVQGNSHDETPLTSAPTKIPIPSGSFFEREHGKWHDLQFIHNLTRL
jgi:hypothetical protein